MTDARAGRVAEVVLAEPTPAARVGGVSLVVLTVTPGGITEYWWDDVTLSFQALDPQEYYWDGAAIQPVQATTDGWWDSGTSTIEPLG